MKGEGEGGRKDPGKGYVLVRMKPWERGGGGEEKRRREKRMGQGEESKSRWGEEDREGINTIKRNASHTPHPQHQDNSFKSIYANRLRDISYTHSNSPPNPSAMTVARRTYIHKRIHTYIHTHQQKSTLQHHTNRHDLYIYLKTQL